MQREPLALSNRASQDTLVGLSVDLVNLCALEKSVHNKYHVAVFCA